MRSSRQASIMAAPSASSARIITEAPDRRAEEDPRCRFGTSQLLYLGSRRGPPWGRHFPPPCGADPAPGYPCGEGRVTTARLTGTLPGLDGYAIAPSVRGR